MKNTESSVVQWHIEGDRSLLAARLAAHVADWLQAALERRERASLALSGGSTPRLFLQALSQQVLPWERVDVLPVDERWVAPDSDQANERLIRETLLVGEASRARFFPLLGAEVTAQAQARQLDLSLRAVARPLDVAVMGMGEDAHTASWFPGAPELDEALPEASERLCVAATAPSAPSTRLTLTWPVIRDAAHCALLIHGGDKKHRLQQVLDTTGSVTDEPVRILLRRPLSIYWSA